MRRPRSLRRSTLAGTADVLDLLDASIEAAAAGAAMETGLFWLLAEAPLSLDGIAGRFDIPLRRTLVWLEILERVGLVDASATGYRPSALTRDAILARWSRDTWALLAQEARERRQATADLAQRLQERRPAESGTDYVSLMSAEPERARRFTRMLCEIHAPLAERIAETLDLAGDRRLLDLGGGSGVISMALARRLPGLACTVMDIPNVCAAGREIVHEHGLADRVAHVAGDILRDPLPAGFDVVLECDVGVYDATLFDRIRAAIRPGGRFVVIDQLRQGEDSAPARLSWALEHALANPDHFEPTLRDVRMLLAGAGFQVISERALVGGGRGTGDPFGDETLVEARKPTGSRV